MTVNYTPGALTKVSINGTNMAAISSTVGKKEVILQRDGLRGTRSRFDTDARKGPQRIGGTIVLEPSYAELAALMALAIGTGGNAADQLTEFSVVVDRYVRNDTYAGCKIGRATITGTQGGIISCSLDIVGKTETINSGSVGAPASDIPFILADLALTLASAARETHSFTLIIDNMLDADRFLNSVTLSQVVEQGRTVTLSSVHPWNDATAALYDQAIAGAAGTLVLNNGTNTGTLSFGRLQVPAESADRPGKTEVLFTLNMLATKVNGSAAGTTDDVNFA
jgi:hypothetical protein